jgi:uncharacterized protein Yka (UPF0111/DUF47 family)
MKAESAIDSLPDSVSIRRDATMAFSLLPREVKFFDMFDEAAAILTRAAETFLDMVAKFERGAGRGDSAIHTPDRSGVMAPLAANGTDRVAQQCEKLRQEEHACDLVVGRIIKALDISFITPFDREDIHTLARRLDDVMDNMEETAHRFMIFRISKPTSEAVTLVRIVRDACGHIEKALRLCRSMRDLDGIQQHLRAITHLENEADKLYRETDAALFANPPEILQFIKLRELYGWLEETVDACKDVAMIISEIVIKGS